MKLSEFILKENEKKKLALLHSGILIGKRKNDHQQVFLFQVDNYYVEAFFNLKNKEVQEYRATYNLNVLNPYLQTIEIDQLFTWEEEH
jgi:hypothetical protein